MSKVSEKKPVGFATHIVAGGLAGATEAVRSPSFAQINRCTYQTLCEVMLPASRYDQGPYATLEIWSCPGSKFIEHTLTHVESANRRPCRRPRLEASSQPGYP